MSGGRKAVYGLAVTLAVAFGSGPAVSQQTSTQATPTAAPAPAQPSAKSGTLSFSSTVNVDTNPGLAATSPGTQVSFTQGVNLSVKTETKTQVLTMSASGGLDLSFGSQGNSSSLNQPTVRVNYTRNAANSRLSGTYNYWSGDVVSSFDADPTTVTDIVVVKGDLTRQNARVVLDLGRQAPFSTKLTVSQRTEDFTGPVNPNIYDETTTTYQAASTLRFSGVTQGNVSVSYTDYDSSDPFSTRSETTSVSLGLSHELRRGLLIDASVGAQQQTIRQFGAPASFDGMFASLGLSQLLPDGNIFGSLDYDGTGGSTRTSLTFGRSLDLPTGTLSGSVTAANVDGNGVQFYGSAGYSHALSDGSLDLQLNQSVSKDQSNNDVLKTQLNVVYAKQINQNSALDVTLDFARSEDGGAGSVPTKNRGTLVASVNQSLTSEWNMAYGYRFRFYDDLTSPLRGSNSVFVTVSRNFQFNF